MKTQSCTSSEVDALCRRAEKLTNPTKLADVGQKKGVSSREVRERERARVVDEGPK